MIHFEDDQLVELRCYARVPRIRLRGGVRLGVQMDHDGYGEDLVPVDGPSPASWTGSLHEGPATAGRLAGKGYYDLPPEMRDPIGEMEHMEWQRICKITDAPTAEPKEG